MSVLSLLLTSCALASAESVSPATLTVLSPRDYQVFQRRTESEGPILISGRLTGTVDRLELRIEGKPRKGRLRERPRRISVDPVTGIFNEVLDGPAGGWYRLELVATRDRETVARAEVAHFGVGEVLMGAGQSNSTNCGQFRTAQTTNRVATFSGAAWRLADDPQLGVHDRSEGGSFWPALGDALVRRFDVPIGVATTGHGGTSINNWEPGGELFDWFMTRAHQLGPLGFRAVLWHQGESDVMMSADEYYSKLSAVIGESKRLAGWEFPWFVAQVSYHSPENPFFPNTREAQQQLWDDGVALRGPDTDVLTGDHRDYEGGGIHFSPKGLKAHGEMWAAIVGDYLEARLNP